MTTPLSPEAQAAATHELDLLRAARQGIDLSGLAPDERCKYPSRFCSNKRTRKSTGKLHRFCDLHRKRASVNQKRWTEIRRRHQRSQEMVNRSCTEAMAMEMAEITSRPIPLPAVPLKVQVPVFSHGYYSKQDDTSAPPSPTQVDAQDALFPLSDDDLERLMAVVVQSQVASCDHTVDGDGGGGGGEKEGEEEDAWLAGWVVNSDLALADSVMLFDDFADELL